MRALLIFVVAAAFVIFECQSLQCYNCVHPANCLKNRSGKTTVVSCNAGEVCQRVQVKTSSPSTKSERGDDFGTIGGAIMERLCNKKASCEAKQKLKIYTTTCCDSDLCNK